MVLGPGLPLVGVMRVLFPPINQPNEDVLAEESNEEKQQREPGKDPIQVPGPKHAEPPELRFRKTCCTS